MVAFYGRFMGVEDAVRDTGGDTGGDTRAPGLGGGCGRRSTPPPASVAKGGCGTPPPSILTAYSLSHSLHALSRWAHGAMRSPTPTKPCGERDPHVPHALRRRGERAGRGCEAAPEAHVPPADVRYLA